MTIAISGVAVLMFATGGVSLGGSEALAFGETNISSVLLEGESTSEPADGWNTYPTKVAEFLPGAAVVADGEMGAQIEDLNGEGSKAELLSAGIDVAVLWIGINDIAEANNPAVVYDQMTTWVAARRAEGWERVVVVTVPKFESDVSLAASSWGSHELADNARSQLNDLIVLNQAGADSVVDLRVVEGIGDAFPVDDQAWRSDKVHLTPDGYERVANYVLAAISQL